MFKVDLISDLCGEAELTASCVSRSFNVYFLEINEELSSFLLLMEFVGGKRNTSKHMYSTKRGGEITNDPPWIELNRSDVTA